MKLFFAFSCLWLSGLSLFAQTDTLKKFASGNVLLRNANLTRLVGTEGGEIGSWTETVQNLKQGDRQFGIVRKTDAQGNKKAGVFDQVQGAFILPVEYDQISRLDPQKGSYETRKGKNYGLFLAPTAKVMPPVYNYVGRHLNPNWVIVCSPSCGYVYDDQLVLVDSIPGMKSVHSRIINGNREWLHVNMAGYQGLLDRDNKLLSNKDWEHIHDVKGNLAIVQNNMGIGLYDMVTGKMTRPYSYSDFWRDTFGGQAFLQHGNKWLQIDHTGKLLVDFVADDIEIPARGEGGGFYFKQKGLWGVRNNKGQVIQVPIWDAPPQGALDEFSARTPGPKEFFYSSVYKEIKGEKVLVGIRKLTAADMTTAVQDEPRAVIEMSNEPAPLRHEEGDKVFVKMEVEPTFVQYGNEADILKQRIEDYKKEHKVSDTGTVLLKFVVEKDGSLSGVTVSSSPGNSLSETSQEFLYSIKGWIPGIQSGRSVRGQKILTLKW